ncbi:SRPBCC family protein [Streptomyces sp. NBC_01190]|uniref:SRPBCC family protein n=1 Tax=Streptomyces sp. NBC_01190 TaxID=2903767 RepID=UPI00386C7961|nr:SRPBCC family protein [Streptomyces sp. NBC_01190]
MSGRFEVRTEIDRPIDEVFAYLAAGTNDPHFSPRVQEIVKDPAGPTAVGTVFRSTVKDAGMTSKREIRITELEAPSKVRWTETSKNTVTSSEGGYDLAPGTNGGTQVTLYNVLEGHGIGKVLLPIALSTSRKDAPAFGERIKKAVEASSGPGLD